MNTSHEFGQKAERDAAEWFLLNKMAVLVARNYRCRGGEIDLIFEEYLPDVGKWELVFVEVRARDLSGWVTGAESVDWKKKRKLMKTADVFLQGYKGRATSIRFDLMAWNRQAWSEFSIPID